MHSHLYCKTLRRVPKRDLVNALHASLMQLRACGSRVERNGRTIDNEPAIARAERMMKAAGHPGY